jgi:transcriptional regulator with XRE-family HTH domain
MKHPPTFNGYGPIINRFADVMIHVKRFEFRGVQRLAIDADISPSSVSRLINNKINPSFALVARVTAAIEKELGMKIDPRDLIAENGEFLTRSVCDLTACPGCLPDNAMDEFGETKPAFANITPGTWVTSRYPKGFVTKKGV